MKCVDARRLMFALEDGELTPDNSTLLHEHLAECESCRVVHLAHLEMREQLGAALIGPLAAPDVVESVMAAIEVPRRPTFRLWTRLAVAATASAAAAAVWLLCLSAPVKHPADTQQVRAPESPVQSPVQRVQAGAVDPQENKLSAPKTSSHLREARRIPVIAKTVEPAGVTKPPVPAPVVQKPVVEDTLQTIPGNAIVTRFTEANGTSLTVVRTLGPGKGGTVKMVMVVDGEVYETAQEIRVVKCPPMEDAESIERPPLKSEVMAGGGYYGG